jgi:hypothetical protein
VITALALGRSGYSLLYESGSISAQTWSLSLFAGAVLSLCGIVMIAGFATTVSGPFACALLVFSLLWLRLPITLLTVMTAGLSAVSAMLGPGSYSLDARLLGWRRIEIAHRVHRPDS